MRHCRYCAIQIINSVISHFFHAWSLKDFVPVCSFLFIKVCRQFHVTWTSPDKACCCQVHSADNQITPALGKNSYDPVKFGKIYDPAVAEIYGLFIMKVLNWVVIDDWQSLTTETIQSMYGLYFVHTSMFLLQGHHFPECSEMVCKVYFIAYSQPVIGHILNKYFLFKWNISLILRANDHV